MSTDAAGRSDGIVSFGPFQLDSAGRALRRDGASVPLSSQALDALVLLVQSAPEIVSKEQLIRHVWGGAAVEETALRFHISALRKALGEADSANAYISTVSGRGYCFVAPLSRSHHGSPPRGDPPREAAGVAHTNLPLRLSSIIGRERDLDQLAHWLDEAGLITVVGPGGVGKTRLAVELGWRSLKRFEGGVWLVDLAPIVDPGAVASATALALGLAVENVTATGSVIAALRRAPALLILDNCEHLTSAVAGLVQTLLAQTPGLTILAASQESLLQPIGRTYDLKPLDTPPDGAAEIDRFPAVELFAARARALDRRFELTDLNRAGVSEICRQLDGLPLALEMAAGRLRSLLIDDLRQGLNDRLRLLKTSSGEAARHASLHSMVDWSHSLLSAFDQAVFRRLAIFPAGFSLEAAIAVATHRGADRWEIVDALGRLIEKSLVTVERREPARYRLLATLRVYAVERLAAADEADLTAERHAAHVSALLCGAMAAWEGTPDPDWLASYGPELDNTRAALDWTLSSIDRREAALALAGPSLHFFHTRALFAEGRKYGERLLSLIEEARPSPVTAELLFYNARLWLNAVDERAAQQLRQVAAMFRDLGDRHKLSLALMDLGYIHLQKSEHSEVAAIMAEVGTLLGPDSPRKTRLVYSTRLATTALRANQLDVARERYAALAQMCRDQRSFGEAAALSNLSVVEYRLGDVEAAIARASDAVQCARTTPGRRSLSLALVNLAAYLLVEERSEEARVLAQEAFEPLNETSLLVPGYLHTMAALLGAEGRLAEAARIIGFVDAELSRRGLQRPLSEHRLYHKLTQRLEAGLPAAELAALRRQGGQWDEGEAWEFAGLQLFDEGRLPRAWSEPA